MTDDFKEKLVEFLTIKPTNEHEKEFLKLLKEYKKSYPKCSDEIIQEYLSNMYKVNEYLLLETTSEKFLTKFNNLKSAN